MIDRNQINALLDKIDELKRSRDRMMVKMEPLFAEYQKAIAELNAINDELAKQIATVRQMTETV